MVIGQDEMRAIGRLIARAREGDHERDSTERIAEADGLRQREHRIAVVHEEHVDLPRRHRPREFRRIRARRQAIQGVTGAIADRLAHVSGEHVEQERSDFQLDRVTIAGTRDPTADGDRGRSGHEASRNRANGVRSHAGDRLHRVGSKRRERACDPRQ
jgi:hypothetical protein